MTHLRIISILFISILILAGCSSTKTITTPETESSPEIDGNISDWDMQETLIERTDIADYYATHDNEFLYLYIDVKSPGHNQAMKQSGFIIYLNSNPDLSSISIAAVKTIETELDWHFLPEPLTFSAKTRPFTTISHPTRSGFSNHKTGNGSRLLNPPYLTV